MRHIININPGQSGHQKTVDTGFRSQGSLTQIIKSLTQTLTRNKKTLEGKSQEP